MIESVEMNRDLVGREQSLSVWRFSNEIKILQALGRGIELDLMPDISTRVQHIINISQVISIRENYIKLILNLMSFSESKKKKNYPSVDRPRFSIAKFEINKSLNCSAK